MIDGLITGTVNLALFGLVILVRRLAHHEGLAAFGLQTDVRSWRLLLVGLAAGTLLFATYAVVAVAFGAGRLFVAWPALADTLVLLASWGFGFAGVALFEEALFRGYLLSKLCVRFSSAVAITAQAVLFGAFHLMAYTPTRYLWLGLVNVTVLAVVYAVVVLRTHALMMSGSTSHGTLSKPLAVDGYGAHARNGIDRDHHHGGVRSAGGVHERAQAVRFHTGRLTCAGADRATGVLWSRAAAERHGVGQTRRRKNVG